jgi:hypothetical protein
MTCEDRYIRKERVQYIESYRMVKVNVTEHYTIRWENVGIVPHIL